MDDNSLVNNRIASLERQITTLRRKLNFVEGIVGMLAFFAIGVIYLGGFRLRAGTIDADEVLAGSIVLSGDGQPNLQSMWKSGINLWSGGGELTILSGSKFLRLALRDGSAVEFSLEAGKLVVTCTDKEGHVIRSRVGN
jgi:hypothetical protein